MAAATSRFQHLLLVALVLLCFISITTQARNLGVVVPGNHRSDEKISHGETLKHGIQEDRALEPDDESNDLLAMDYTPARKKPPIHN